MNETIEQLKNHRTYRDFDEKYQIPATDLQQILDASRQAPSWMNGQFYSIIVIQDPLVKQQLKNVVAGNPHLVKNSVLLVFVGDLHRTKQIADHFDTPYPISSGINPLLIATTDASLALENAVIAASALNLASGIIGNIRQNSQAVAEILHLPEQTFPVAALAIGKPTVEMAVKPRLPEKAVIHYDHYRETDYATLEAYDQTMEAFAEKRETKRWTVKFKDYFSQEPNQTIDAFLRTQGVLK